MLMDMPPPLLMLPPPPDADIEMFDDYSLVDESILARASDRAVIGAIEAKAGHGLLSSAREIASRLESVEFTGATEDATGNNCGHRSSRISLG